MLDEAVITVPAELVKETARTLHDQPELAFDYLRSLSAVDYVEYLEVVYHLWSTQHHQKMVMKVRLEEPDLSLDSVISVWRGADWHEREASDLFGIQFIGNPNPRRLLLAEEFEGFPLRKSYPLAPYPSADVEAEGEA